MILRATIEADGNRLPAPATCLWSAGFWLTAVPAFIVRIHLFAGILHFCPGPMQVYAKSCARKFLLSIAPAVCPSRAN